VNHFYDTEHDANPKPNTAALIALVV